MWKYLGMKKSGLKSKAVLGLSIVLLVIVVGVIYADTVGYYVWKNKEEVIGVWEKIKEGSRELAYTWNPEKTRILGSKVSVTVTLADRTGFTLYFNDEKIVEFLRMYPWNPSRYSKTIDVTAYLRNGVNEFKYTVWKAVWLPETRSGTFTVVWTISYEGEAPKPPRPTIPWEWIALILAIVVIVILLVYVLWRRRK